ncbi:toxin-like outer membrane protein [Helicobacter pylori]|nr:toxin-like outer membrane protein [Helicobacter pylori]
MKKFKKKPKSIKRSHQKTILKRPLWLAPLLISGFASGVYANNLWDLLNPKVGGEYVHWVKGSQYCAWWEFAGCLKNVWGANHKGYDAGNAANYLSSQNYQAISVGSGNETGTYSLSGFTNYVGGNLTINLGNSVVLDLSGSNSFTSYQGYNQSKDDISFNVGAINLNGTLEVGNRVGSGAGTHTGTATLNLNANKVNINSNISAFKTSQVNIGNANSAITIGSVSLSGDTCSSLASVGVGANCSTSGLSYSFKGTTNATNTAFSNANGSFTFEENATFSGAKLNGGHSLSIRSLTLPIIPPLIAVVLVLRAQVPLMTRLLTLLYNISNMTITGSVTLSGFNGNIMHSLANNVDVGMYARAFLKRNEFTLSANETYEGNASNINSSNSLLSVLNQRYNYNTWTTSVNGNYGYDFMFKQKSVVLKPQVGLSYHFIGLSAMKGRMNDAAYKQFLMHSNPLTNRF